MVEVSREFKKAMKEPVKEIYAYIETDNDENITSDDDLISFKITSEGSLCNTVMKQCEIAIIGEHDYLLGSDVTLWLGTLTTIELEEPVIGEDGELITTTETVEYLSLGTFYINDAEISKDRGKTTLKGFDHMIKFYVPYTQVFEYPLSLYEFTQAICEECGLELANDTFINHDLEIGIDYYSNIFQITYRDILKEIAECTCSIAIINSEGKLEFKRPTQTDELLTYDSLFNLDVKDKYGPINSVVLSRQPQKDNIFLQDEGIDEEDIIEFRIDNNQLLDKRREETITSIYDAMKGISYVPFSSKTEGLGWFEIGDIITIEESKTIFNEDSEVIDIETHQYQTIVLGIDINIDGGISETLKAAAPVITETNYQRAGGITDRIKNTEIVVDKQQQYIESLVTDMYNEDGILNEHFTKVYQDIHNLITSIQNSGGSNLIKNSVMFAYDSSRNPDSWEVIKDVIETEPYEKLGTLNMQTSKESINAGAISGHEFILNGVLVKQKIDVTKDEKYTFSTRIKKSYKGTCCIKIYNELEEYRIDLTPFDGGNYIEYVIDGIVSTSNYYYIEIYGSYDSNSTFTDVMLSLGELKQQWSQANGEIMNTQVVISVDGVKVKSSIYQGDYTVMSPLEFAGYSNVNGSITRVFSLNKDTTEMKKIAVKDEMAMKPIKIVPIKEGYMTGWAFVSDRE